MALSSVNSDNNRPQSNVDLATSGVVEEDGRTVAESGNGAASTVTPEEVARYRRIKALYCSDSDMRDISEADRSFYFFTFPFLLRGGERVSALSLQMLMTRSKVEGRLDRDDYAKLEKLSDQFSQLTQRPTA
jgi:hypothetical protein